MSRIVNAAELSLTPETFAPMLTRAMVTHHIDKRALAHKSKVTVGEIETYVTGKKLPDPSVFKRMVFCLPTMAHMKPAVVAAKSRRQMESGGKTDELDFDAVWIPPPTPSQPAELPSAFHERLRELRTRDGLSQADVGSLCKASNQIVSAWEAGKAIAIPHYEALVNLWPALLAAAPPKFEAEKMNGHNGHAMNWHTNGAATAGAAPKPKPAPRPTPPPPPLRPVPPSAPPPAAASTKTLSQAEIQRALAGRRREYTPALQRRAAVHIPAAWTPAMVAAAQKAVDETNAKKAAAAVASPVTAPPAPPVVLPPAPPVVLPPAPPVAPPYTPPLVSPTSLPVAPPYTPPLVSPTSLPVAPRPVPPVVMPPAPPVAPPPGWLTLQSVAVLMSVSENTVQSWTRAKMLPFEVRHGVPLVAATTLETTRLLSVDALLSLPQVREHNIDGGDLSAAITARAITPRREFVYSFADAKALVAWKVASLLPKPIVEATKPPAPAAAAAPEPRRPNPKHMGAWMKAIRRLPVDIGAFHALLELAERDGMSPSDLTLLLRETLEDDA